MSYPEIITSPSHLWERIVIFLVALALGDVATGGQNIHRQRNVDSGFALAAQPDLPPPRVSSVTAVNGFIWGDATGIIVSRSSLRECILGRD